MNLLDRIERILSSPEVDEDLRHTLTLLGLIYFDLRTYRKNAHPAGLSVPHVQCEEIDEHLEQVYLWLRSNNLHTLPPPSL